MPTEKIHEVIYPFYSIIILIFAEFLCIKLKLFQNYTILIQLMNGVYFAFQVSKLIVCTMSDVKINYNFLFYFSEKNWKNELWEYSLFNINYYCDLFG